MALHQIHFKANPALWRADSQERLAVSEAAFQGGEGLLATGAMKEITWVSSSEEYARVEGDSAAGELAICTMFFPMFTQEVQELVPWDVAKAEIFGAVRQAAE